MSDIDKQDDWTKPAALALPEGRVLRRSSRDDYGPIFPKTPACYGFTIIAKVKPGREQAIRDYGKNDRGSRRRTPRRPRAAQAALPALGALRYRLRHAHFMYQGIFDTDFDKYTEDAVALFIKTGINTVFENLEGFPRTGRRTRRRSSSSSATTSARASSNTANTRT